MAKKSSKFSIIDMISGIEQEDNVVIFTHPTPDPDSLASAFGIKWILSKNGINSTILYDGEVSHPQNKTMINYLNIPAAKRESDESYDKIIIVDGNEKSINESNVYCVIDHHREESSVKMKHIEMVGATSTLIWEHIKALDIKFEDDQDYNLATALYLGIITDTNELRSEGSTDRDNNAAWQLLKVLDRKKLDCILDYEIPSYFFELREQSVSNGNSIIDKMCWVCSVGIIPPTKRDVLPMLAEDMIKREGISVSVVLAIIDDEMQASVRSKNAALDVDSFCKKVFGRNYGGGRLGCGGARVPLGLCSFKDLPAEIEHKFYDAFKDKMFHQILHIAAGNK